MSSEWDHIDALVLASVADEGGERTELARIIGLVGYVDRTVLTHDELQRALNRLLGSGLIDAADLRFRRTALGDEIYERCPATGSLDRARWIATYLQDRVACHPVPEWSLPQASFDSALHEYRAEMQRLIDRKS